MNKFNGHTRTIPEKVVLIRNCILCLVAGAKNAILVKNVGGQVVRIGGGGIVVVVVVVVVVVETTITMEFRMVLEILLILVTINQINWEMIVRALHYDRIRREHEQC